jgi:hypothetical protein
MGKTNHYANQTPQKEMIYEPGTRECRILISAKEKIISAQSELASLNGNECSSIQETLSDIYRKLDHMHSDIKEPIPF